MHELSVCLSLLQQLEKIAAEHNATAVEEVVLRVGPLSGVEPALLRNAYPLAAAGTIAAAAVLIIEDSEIVVSCSECGAESPAQANRLLCAKCGDYRTKVISGDEMILQRLEMSFADHALQAAP
jgi:hydrogenase nickel incorporation protein HypA/HybF